MVELEKIRELFYRSLDYLADDGSGFEVGSKEQCYWSISGFNNPFSNRLAVYNADPVIFDEVVQPFYVAKLPHYIKLGGAGLEHAATLISRGYVNDGASPQMVYKLDPLRDHHELAPGLLVKKVETREELQICKEILNDGFQRPKKDDGDFDDPFPEVDSSHRYLLYADGAPVSTTQFLRSGAFISCFATSTRTHEQRKGYGSELMRWALAKHAAEGDEIVVLQSSTPGQILYERIGFEVLEYYQNWMLNEFARDPSS